MNPEAEWFFHQGGKLIAAGKFEESVAAYTRCLEVKQSHEKAMANRAWAKHCLGHFEDAIADHQRALALDPGDGIAISNYAASLSALGRDTEALTLLDGVIGKQPPTAQLYADRGALHFKLRQYEAANDDFLAGIRMDPLCFGAHVNLANLLATFGMLKDALFHAEIAERLDPRGAAIAETIRNQLRSGQHE